MDVVRFVVPDESRIQAQGVAQLDVVKATALGVSPLAATLTLIVGEETADRVPRILEWLAAHRPDLAVIDYRPD